VTINKNLTIGTRDSLLAVTQSTLIKEEITEKTGLHFELLKIKTQGDQQLDKPLWQLDGKDFFTKELDSLLLENKIDMVVHSYKDLGSDRPQGIELAAITKRDFANDILLIKEETIAKLPSMSEFIVGTSSPRRIENTESSLNDFLPNSTQIQNITCKMLRGNVNTRIQKLRDGNYDAIILAHAGLERLALKENSHEVLKGLLSGLNFMILPQKSFPSSASQGALALEIREDADESLREKIKSVHCSKTQSEVADEREVFNSYGGGCHLAVGIHVKRIHDFLIRFTKGIHNNVKINKVEINGYDYTSLKGLSTYFVFSQHDFLIDKVPVESKSSGQNLFVTGQNCFHNIGTYSSIWSGGSRTTMKLTERGYWVNGSSEGFGHEELQKLKESKSIQLMLKTQEWKTLSHDHAQSCVSEVLPCYSHEVRSEIDEIKLEEIMCSDIIYWSSVIQFDEYIKKFPGLKDKIHACGLGKTYSELNKRGITPVPCIDMNHLKTITSKG
jgi:hydroxymethylbilane synthase